MKINKKEENKILKRLEVEAEQSYSGATPSRKDLRKQLSSSLKAKPELVVIKKINNQFGENRIIIQAHVYNAVDDLEKTEPKYIVQRHKKGEKSEEEKPAEKEPATPAPAEPKIEEEKKVEEEKKEEKESKSSDSQ